MTESCEDRVQSHLRERIEDIRKLWKMYQRDTDAYDEDLGNLNEYGLCFDYVAKGTFSDQKKGYFRWQLSFGGPSDEFRFYVDETLVPYTIEYWFLDWFDGAHVDLEGEDFELLEEIYNDFKEMGVVQSEIDKARDG